MAQRRDLMHTLKAKKNLNKKKTFGSFEYIIIDNDDGDDAAGGNLRPPNTRVRKTVNCGDEIINVTTA